MRCTRLIVLRLDHATPGSSPSDTDSSTNSTSLSRCASVAVSGNPALLINYRSSKTTLTESRLAGPAGTSGLSCTIQATT